MGTFKLWLITVFAVSLIIGLVAYYKSVPKDLVINYHTPEITGPREIFIDFQVSGESYFQVNVDGKVSGEDGRYIGQLTKKEIEEMDKILGYRVDNDVNHRKAT